MFREDGANGPSDLFLAQSSHSVATPAKCHGQTSSPTNEDLPAGTSGALVRLFRFGNAQNRQSQWRE
jgi:hypothetical protein